ncbi:uncharacterized protein LOC119976490 [Scyliorhinus canicula]|uniref:uncharacterized protein LOC119976490 n=1 Tax=Scyliorhinus canicula TaxID=7830 RepID=UPI0018F5A09A|nr:uncharacterized protein LOC119976490 [Scyliorhinus canicula]
MEEGAMMETEAESGSAGAGDSNPDAASLRARGDLPEEDQSEAAPEPDSRGDSRDEEEVQTDPSPYLEMLTEPANRAVNKPTPMWAGDGLAEETSQNETSPAPQPSEADISADSGLNGENEYNGGQEDGEVTAFTDTSAEMGQPSCPTGGSGEDDGPTPQNDCTTEVVRHLRLDLLPLDTNNVNNTTKRLTPDFSDREVFLDLVWEVQSRRLNDQRCSFRKKVKDRRAYRSMPSTPLDKEKHFFPSMSSLQTEEFFDLIAYSQSRRINDQRADFEDSPTVELSSPFPADIVEYLAPVGRTASDSQRGEAPAATPAEANQNPAGEEEIPAEEVERPAEGAKSPAEAAGGPAEGAGSPAEGARSPAEGAGSPAEGAGSPAEGARSPAEGAGSPAEGAGSPAEGAGSPAEGAGCAAEGAERPEEVDASPAEEAGSPSRGTEYPGDGAESPAGEAENPSGGADSPGEKGEAPAEEEKNPVEREELPAVKVKKEPEDELYNTIMTHQSASARIEDQRSHPPAYSSQAFFDLLHRLQEQRMDEQRASLPPGLAPKRVPNRVQEERRGSFFSPLLKGMAQRRANSS